MSPTLAGPRKGRVRWRQKRGCLVARSGAYKVRVEAELSEVLKPPDSVPRTPQPRTPGPSRSSQARPQVPRPRPVRFRETSRDRSPSGVSFRAPPRVTLGTQLSLTGIGELALRPRLARRRVPSRGWREDAHPFPGLQRGSREPGGGGGGPGRGCVRWAGSSLPGGLLPVFSLQLLPRPRRRPSSLTARRPTCRPEAGNCRSSALCPDGTVTAEPTPPTRNLLLGSNTRASEVPL